MEINKIIHGDCFDVIRKIPKESIDLTVTSPPYKSADGYNMALIRSTFSYLIEAHKSGSLLFVNFGHLAEDKFRPFEVAKEIIESGWGFNDTIIWKKNHYTPLAGKKRVNNLFEFIFLFYKDFMPDLDRLAIGIPYSDKGCVTRYGKGIDLHCGGNVWEIDYETLTGSNSKLHPDRFPLELPTRCIKLANLRKGSLVFDPFSGSCTTLLAAKNLGHNYLGAELKEENVKQGERRLAQELLF